MTGIKCRHCKYVGGLEYPGMTFDGKTGEMPISGSFKYKGNNPSSGNLHYRCPRCEKLVLVDPMDVRGAVGGADYNIYSQETKGKMFF